MDVKRQVGSKGEATTLKTKVIWEIANLTFRIGLLAIEVLYVLRHSH